MRRQIIIQNDENILTVLKEVSDVRQKQWAIAHAVLPPLTTPRQRSWVESVRCWSEAMCSRDWLGLADLDDGALNMFFEDPQEAYSFATFWRCRVSQ